CLDQSQPLGVITAAENGLPPGALFAIPPYRLLDAGFEILLGPPAQLAFELRGVDGITPVMAGTVGDEADQPPARPIESRRDPVEQIADRFHDMQIGALV